MYLVLQGSLQFCNLDLFSVELYSSQRISSNFNAMKTCKKLTPNVCHKVTFMIKNIFDVRTKIWFFENIEFAHQNIWFFQLYSLLFLFSQQVFSTLFYGYYFYISEGILLNVSIVFSARNFFFVFYVCPFKLLYVSLVSAQK